MLIGEIEPLIYPTPPTDHGQSKDLLSYHSDSILYWMTKLTAVKENKKKNSDYEKKKTLSSNDLLFCL